MRTALIVTEPFCDHAHGDQITDPATVEAVLASDLAGNVNKIEIDDLPADPDPTQ